MTRLVALLVAALAAALAMRPSDARMDFEVRRTDLPRTAMCLVVADGWLMAGGTVWRLDAAGPARAPEREPWGRRDEAIVVPADFDGDGQTDFALFDSLEATVWSGGRAISRWRLPEPVKVAVPLDHDGDGDVDLYTGRLWRNQAASFRDATPEGILVPLPEGLCVLDYDRDGVPDVLVVDLVMGPALLRGMRQRVPLPRDMTSLSVDAVDVNGDGWTDLLLTGQNRVRVMMNRGGKEFEAVLLPEGGERGAFADVDGDGRVEVIVSRASQVRVMTQVEDGWRVVPGTWPGDTQAPMLVHDLTGDGLPDVLQGTTLLASRSARRSPRTERRAPTP